MSEIKLTIDDREILVPNGSTCSHVVEALKALDFLAVQDIFLSETAALADVVLPATTSMEKDGTFTRKILSHLAGLMGFERQFSYTDPSEIMLEIARLTPSYGGISYNRLENDGLQWPCPTVEHPDTPYLHKGQLTRGKARAKAKTTEKSPAGVVFYDLPFCRDAHQPPHQSGA